MSPRTTHSLPKCPICLGKTYILVPCHTCNGSGKNPNTDEDCRDCDISSNEVEEKCHECNGSGLMQESEINDFIDDIKEIKEEIKTTLNDIDNLISEGYLENIKDIKSHLEGVTKSSEFCELNKLI